MIHTRQKSYVFSIFQSHLTHYFSLSLRLVYSSSHLAITYPYEFYVSLSFHHLPIFVAILNHHFLKIRIWEEKKIEEEENKMCYQRLEKHPCTHYTRYKPHFCRYRFNINHQIEPRFSYSSGPCKDCLVRKMKPASPDINDSLCARGVNGESRTRVGGGMGADDITQLAKVDGE